MRYKTAVRVIAIMAGCAIAAGCGTPAATSVAASPSGTTAGASTSAGAGEVLAAPRVAAAPHTAVMPADSTSAKSSASPSAASSPGGSASPGGPASPGAGAPAPATCTHPKYTTSDPSGMWQLSPYFVFNNMWAAGSYPVTQTLYACSYSDWYVVAKMNNDSGDGAVKTYPNSHRDFSEPKITSLSSVTSTFAISGTPAGIYEYAYDIWINGIASSGSTEVMIWNYNRGQQPSGSVVAHATFGGRSYAVWRKGTYIAFVADQNFTSGTMDLLAFFKWIISRGWLTQSATLGQVDYGIELVSTSSAPETFSVSNFAVNAG